MQSATRWAKEVVAMLLGLCGLAEMVYGVGAKQAPPVCTQRCETIVWPRT